MLPFEDDPDPRSIAASQPPGACVIRPAAQAPAISREGWRQHELRSGPAITSFEPPVHCPRCASRLMATVSTVVCGAEVIVARRCPECGLHDSVVTTVLRAALWYRHDTRTLNGLLRLADSLRDARRLAVIEPSGACAHRTHDRSELHRVRREDARAALPVLRAPATRRPRTPTAPPREPAPVSAPARRERREGSLRSGGARDVAAALRDRSAEARDTLARRRDRERATGTSAEEVLECAARDRERAAADRARAADDRAQAAADRELAAAERRRGPADPGSVRAPARARSDRRADRERAPASSASTRPHARSSVRDARAARPARVHRRRRPQAPERHARSPGRRRAAARRRGCPAREPPLLRRDRPLRRRRVPLRHARGRAARGTRALRADRAHPDCHRRRALDQLRPRPGPARRESHDPDRARRCRPPAVAGARHRLTAGRPILGHPKGPRMGVLPPTHRVPSSGDDPTGGGARGGCDGDVLRVGGTPHLVPRDRRDHARAHHRRDPLPRGPRRDARLPRADGGARRRPAVRASSTTSSATGTASTSPTRRPSSGRPSCSSASCTRWSHTSGPRPPTTWSDSPGAACSRCCTRSSIPPGLRSIAVCNSPSSMRLWVAEANRLRLDLPADVQATLTRHETEGTTDSPEYEAATQVFYERHVCRLPVWPEFVNALVRHDGLEPDRLPHDERAERVPHDRQPARLGHHRSPVRRSTFPRCSSPASSTRRRRTSSSRSTAASRVRAGSSSRGRATSRTSRSRRSGSSSSADSWMA